jgi:hypothetical protein
MPRWKSGVAGFAGGHKWRGLDGLRDFLASRAGFVDEQHDVDKVLERRPGSPSISQASSGMLEKDTPDNRATRRPRTINYLTGEWYDSVSVDEMVVF